MRNKLNAFLIIAVIIFSFCFCKKDNQNKSDSPTFTGPIFYNNNGKIINAVCYGPFRDGQWSEASLENSVSYINDIFNERWKGTTDTEAETNRGFYYANRTPKLVFQAGK